MKGDSAESRRIDAIALNLARGDFRGKRRAVAIARTGFWLDQLALKTRKFTPYALGLHLQPETYRKNKDNDRFNHNLWAKYAAGEHVPRPELRRAVDAKVPGSLGNFRHVLFDVLASATPTASEAEFLFRRMHPGVQRAIFELKPLELGYYVRRKSLPTILRALGRQGHLDALAATILLLREAERDRADAERAEKEKAIVEDAEDLKTEKVTAGKAGSARAAKAKNEEDIFMLGNAVYRALLLACVHGPGAGVALDLIVLVRSLVLSSVSSFGRALDTDVEDIVEQCRFLNVAILRLEDNNQVGLADADTMKAAAKIFRGDYGFDLAYALKPRLKAAGDPQALRLSSRRDILRSDVLGNWASGVLRSMSCQQMIPRKVLAELSAKLRTLKG